MDGATRESPLRIAQTAGAIAAGYYVGAHLGFFLRLPPSTPSILWPPNAILTAALLLTPPRRWWIWILAVFPVHVLVELEAAFPPALVLSLFVTNCSEALIAALGVRAFSDAPHRLDTLRRMLAFIVMAALLAPFLSSFLDAFAVHLIRGEAYPQVFRTRFFANVLAQLCVVPTIVTLVTGGRTWLRGTGRRTKLEAAALGAMVILLAVAVFGGTHGVGLSQDAPTPLAYLLPLLMIAAVRFGPAGAAVAFLATTLVAVWAGTYRKGPFADLPQAEAVLALQIYLTVLAIPIYCLASLIEERRRAQRLVDEQLQFQKMLSQLTASFVHLPATEIEGAIREGLRPVGESQHLQSLTLRDGEGRARHAWEDGRSHPPRGRDHRTCLVELVAGDRTLGSLAGTAAAEDAAGEAALEERLQLVAEVFANAMARQEGERALQRSRAELAHFNRVSTMGELAASLAHELRQPLSGILSNAQAALRFLQTASPPVHEVRGAIQDIVEDDRRAAAVIQRLRDLLTKQEPSRTILDLNAVIRSVADLLGSDAVIRRVHVTLQLGPEPIPVCGDRIQLEQVVLNLMLNGMEAMTDCGGRERTLRVTTECEDSRARMAVVDAGSGLRAGTEEEVFQPFFTTKSAGMGMGLSIARSIVESHGGTIRAANNSGPGATFHLVLPLHPR